MKRVHVASTLLDAQLAADALASAGIAARLLNTHAVGALGELPFLNAQPEVWVDDDAQAARACAVLAAIQNTPASDEKACPHCGETNPGHFLSCWRCGGRLPA